jgi:hypothetical protein
MGVSHHDYLLVKGMEHDQKRIRQYETKNLIEEAKCTFQPNIERVLAENLKVHIKIKPDVKYQPPQISKNYCKHDSYLSSEGKDNRLA